MCELSNVGLWVDALNFCVVTLQIILFNTRYTETIKEDVIKKERVADRCDISLSVQPYITTRSCYNRMLHSVGFETCLMPRWRSRMKKLAKGEARRSWT